MKTSQELISTDFKKKKKENTLSTKKKELDY